MKCFEWLNKQVGEFDVFLIADANETESIVQYFGVESARGCKSHFSDEWYYFVNTKNKTITPMPFLALAFGGQYNGDTPIGEEIASFSLGVNEYSLRTYK